MNRAVILVFSRFTPIICAATSSWLMAMQFLPYCEVTNMWAKNSARMTATTTTDTVVGPGRFM